MDLLAILPYYIEIAMQKDTVSLCLDFLFLILCLSCLVLNLVYTLPLLNTAHVSSASRLPSIQVQ
jgi:hypothetical protein